MSAAPLTGLGAPSQVVQRHPVRGGLYGLLLGFSLALWSILFAVVAFGDWLILAIIVVVGIALGIVWSMFAPAKQPKAGTAGPLRGNYGSAPQGAVPVVEPSPTPAYGNQPTTPPSAATPPPVPSHAAPPGTPPPSYAPMTAIPGSGPPPTPAADDLKPDFLNDDDDGDDADAGRRGPTQGDAAHTIIADPNRDPG